MTNQFPELQLILICSVICLGSVFIIVIIMFVARQIRINKRKKIVQELFDQKERKNGTH